MKTTEECKHTLVVVVAVEVVLAVFAVVAGLLAPVVPRRQTWCQKFKVQRVRNGVWNYYYVNDPENGVKLEKNSRKKKERTENREA